MSTKNILHPLWSAITPLFRLSPSPEIDDEGDEVASSNTHHAIGVILLVALSLALYIQRNAPHDLNLLFIVILWFTTFGAVVLNRLGYRRTAAILISYSFLFGAFGLALSAPKRLFDSAMLFFPAVIVVAGLLLSRRMFLLLVSLAVVLVSAMVILSAGGWTIDPAAMTVKPSDYFEYPVIISVTALVVLLLTGYVRSSLQRVRASEQRYRSLVETMPDGVYRSTPEGRFLEVNPALVRMLGYTRKEDLLQVDIGRSLFLIAGEREQTLERLAKSTMAQFQVRRKDGAIIWVEIHGRAERNAQGRIQYFEGIVRDVTERIEAERAFRHAQKMESLGVLSGGVAHDFNNLLQAILGHVSLALMRTSPEERIHTQLQKIETVTLRAADLTQQLLAYSGRSGFELKRIVLNELIEENLHLLEVSIPKNVRLISDLDPARPVIFADRGQIQQIIMNLIINAGEAIGERPGTITVRTRQETIREGDSEWGEKTGTPVEPGTYALLEVEDTGSGMSGETLDKIFDPFFTTKFTGRGLGLAAALGIIRGHKGGLKVISEEDHGTKFSVAIPSVSLSESIATDATYAPPSFKGSVLVVDDEDDVREVVVDILETHGISLFAASSPEEAIALYQRHQHEITVILLDLSMPGIGGEGALREIRALNPSACVIISSGYAETDVTAQLSGLGIAGFIQKPYRATALLSVLGKLGNAT